MFGSNSNYYHSNNNSLNNGVYYNDMPAHEVGMSASNSVFSSLPSARNNRVQGQQQQHQRFVKDTLLPVTSSLQQQQSFSFANHNTNNNNVVTTKSKNHNSNNNNSNNNKSKQVLPCFNLVCTGTCAYGPKCTFLHDPRVQLPRHLRKQAEFILQSHLHTYRPNVNKTVSAAAAALALSASQQQQHQQQSLMQLKESTSEDEWLSDDTDSEHLSQSCGSNNINNNNANNTTTVAKTTSNHSATAAQNPQSMNIKTFCKDDIFEFPTASLQYNETNSKLYEPHLLQSHNNNNFSIQRAQLHLHHRELSMWNHLLISLQQQQHHQSPDVSSSRLSVFQQLSKGVSVSSSVNNTFTDNVNNNNNNNNNTFSFTNNNHSNESGKQQIYSLF